MVLPKNQCALMNINFDFRKFFSRFKVAVDVNNRLKDIKLPFHEKCMAGACARTDLNYLVVFLPWAKLSSQKVNYPTVEKFLMVVTTKVRLSDGQANAYIIKVNVFVNIEICFRFKHRKKMDVRSAWKRSNTLT